jgi:hypothetical protein
MQTVERLRGWRERNPVIATLLFASAIVAALVVLADATINVVRFVDHQVLWRDEEYEKLERLKAGFSFEVFDETLGAPVFVRDRGQVRERTYKGRDYWVQTVSGSDGVVTLYSVTSCDEDFKPEFSIAGGSENGTSDSKIQLHESEAGSVIADSTHTRLNFFYSGATANSRFLTTWSSGNPSNYKAYAWGYTDPCEGDRLPPRVEALGDDGLFYGSVDEAPRSVRDFGNRVSVNTFAETAPLKSLSAAEGPFQIGPDRILVRTTYGSGA